MRVGSRGIDADCFAEIGQRRVEVALHQAEIAAIIVENGEAAAAELARADGAVAGGNRRGAGLAVASPEVGIRLVDLVKPLFDPGLQFGGRACRQPLLVVALGGVEFALLLPDPGAGC